MLENKEFFIKEFSKSLEEMSPRELKPGYSRKIVESLVQTMDLNDSLVWHKSFRQRALDLIPLIKESCYAA